MDLPSHPSLSHVAHRFSRFFALFFFSVLLLELTDGSFGSASRVLSVPLGPGRDALTGFAEPAALFPDGRLCSWASRKQRYPSSTVSRVLATTFCAFAGTLFTLSQTEIATDRAGEQTQALERCESSEKNSNGLSPNALAIPVHGAKPATSLFLTRLRPRFPEEETAEEARPGPQPFPSCPSFATTGGTRALETRLCMTQRVCGMTVIREWEAPGSPEGGSFFLSVLFRPFARRWPEWHLLRAEAKDSARCGLVSPAASHCYESPRYRARGCEVQVKTF